MSFARFCAAIALSLTFVAHAAGITPLVAIDFTGDLYDIDTASGAASNPRSTGLAPVIGLADRPNGDLYTITGFTSSVDPDSLFRIDGDTGDAQLIGSLGETMAEGDLDFDPVSGGLFATHPTAGQYLQAVDVLTGDATRVGFISGTDDMSAMAFADDGRLFMLDTTQDVLWQVDPTDASVIGSTNVNFDFRVLAGMDFDPDSGLLYVADGEGSPTDVYLHTLDVVTGDVTEVGFIGNTRGIVGLRFVPEPASILLLALGALACRRRR